MQEVSLIVKINIDITIGTPGHGKYVVDGLITIDKVLLGNK